MQNLEDFSRALQKGPRGAQLQALAESPEGARLAGMLDGAALQEALKRGDGEALRRALGGVLGTAEGKKLAENIRRVMAK